MVRTREHEPDKVALVLRHGCKIAEHPGVGIVPRHDIEAAIAGISGAANRIEYRLNLLQRSRRRRLWRHGRSSLLRQCEEMGALRLAQAQGAGEIVEKGCRDLNRTPLFEPCVRRLCDIGPPIAFLAAISMGMVMGG